MKVSLKIQIEENHLKKLRAEAERRGCSVAQVIRDLVFAWYDDQRQSKGKV